MSLGMRLKYLRKKDFLLIKIGMPQEHIKKAFE